MGIDLPICCEKGEDARKENARLRVINADLLAALKAVSDMGYEDRSEIWAQVEVAITKAENTA